MDVIIVSGGTAALKADALVVYTQAAHQMWLYENFFDTKTFTFICKPAQRFPQPLLFQALLTGDQPRQSAFCGSRRAVDCDYEEMSHVRLT
jgi:hypothetical protein